MQKQSRTYNPAESAVFFKTREQFGCLSNMAAGFPLCVNGVQIRTSEALYQACRFPHLPKVQRLLLRQHSPMTAKMRAKPHLDRSRPDWDDVRVAVMRWCLRVKLAQHWEAFGGALLETGEWPIVEKSRKDDFWGAKETEDGALVGANVLGRLLMELRGLLQREAPKDLMSVRPPNIERFLLLDEPIGVVYADDIGRTDLHPGKAILSAQSSLLEEPAPDEGVSGANQQFAR